jgi:hypothetical protein
MARGEGPYSSTANKDGPITGNRLKTQPVATNISQGRQQRNAPDQSVNAGYAGKVSDSDGDSD